MKKGNDFDFSINKILVHSGMDSPIERTLSPPVPCHFEWRRSRNEKSINKNKSSFYFNKLLRHDFSIQSDSRIINPFG
jgi:hypothetical protein